ATSRSPSNSTPPATARQSRAPSPASSPASAASSPRGHAANRSGWPDPVSGAREGGIGMPVASVGAHGARAFGDGHGGQNGLTTTSTTVTSSATTGSSLNQR